MVLNDTHSLSEVPVRARVDQPAVQTAGFINVLWRRIGQLVCGFTGHEPLLRVDQARVSLCCPHCGYESPGWNIGPARLKLRYAGDGRRHVLQKSRP